MFVWGGRHRPPPRHKGIKVMSCTFCKESSATWEEHPQGNDLWRLKCRNCGQVDFSHTAYVSRLGTLSDEDKQLLAKHFNGNKGRGEVRLTYDGVDELLEKLKQRRDAELLKAELNKNKNEKR
jgi:hypothetical protein